MMQLDATHATVTALQRLVPEAIVVGGSFAGWLPHPGTLPSAERATTVASARESAVRQCLAQLLRAAGLPEGVEVGKGDGGEREWPTGFVGSLTHKGTVVLGVIAKDLSVPMIGIDLERMDRSDLGVIEHTIAPEGLFPGLDHQLGILLAFSAKEAVFKAQYARTRQKLGFSDVRLAWANGDGDRFQADVVGPVAGLEVRCAREDGWVLSAAIAV